MLYFPTHHFFIFFVLLCMSVMSLLVPTCLDRTSYHLISYHILLTEKEALIEFAQSIKVFAVGACKKQYERLGKFYEKNNKDMPGSFISNIYVYMYIHIYIYIYIFVCMFVCMYVCMFLYMYVYLMCI